MARTMEIKLVLSGMQQASAGMRQIADQTRDLNRTRILPRVMPADQAKTLQTPAPKFLRGPEQRLQEIAQQRASLPQVADPGKREAIGKDLDRAEFLAKRSIALHQRRMENPEESLNGPGLLELFRDLNGLIKSMVAGNPGAVIHHLARGIKLLSNTGGLNIQQKLARTNLPIPAGGSTAGPSAAAVNQAAMQAVISKMGMAGKPFGFTDPTQGMGDPAQVAGSLAPLLASLGKLGGTVLAVVAVLAVLVLAIAATVAVVKTLAGMLLSTAQALAEFHRSVLLSGGNEKSAAFLSRLGLSAQNAAGFRGGLDDPLAQATAASVGVRTGGPMPFGRMDSGKMLEDFIKAVAGIEDQSTRMRKALMVGQPELIEQIELYRRHAKTIDADSAVMGGIFDKESTQQAADFMFQLDRVGKSFQNIMFALAKPFLKDASKWLKGFADTLQQVAQFVNQHGALIKKQLIAVFVVFYNLAKWLAIIITGLLNPTAGAALHEMFRKLEEMTKKWIGAPDQNAALDANTQALQSNTTALQAGTHGGGDRARGAIPSHMRGILLEKAIAGNSLRLGAFMP